MANISVILPCYNVENLVDRCLESIVSQTIGLENLEIICVDDCSTDDTLEVLKQWEEKYPNQFIIVESDRNGRQGQARNIGLSYATSDWIGFIDSDDWVDPEYFERLYEYAKTGKYQIVSCGYERDFSEDLTYFDYSKKPHRGRPVVIDTEKDRKAIIMNPPLGYSAWAKLIQAEFLVENELYFPANLTYEDAAWGQLFHLYVKSAYLLEDKLYHYYVNYNSTVLSGNSSHHLDCITVQTMLWDEWQERGVLERYHDELVIEHIYSAYLAGLKAAIYRYEVPNYNYYLLLRTVCAKRIGDYRENPYIKQGCLDELYTLMMETLDHELNRPQFLEFAESVKKIGI